MKWSIIIPCSNDPDGLRKTLASIFRLMPASFDAEIIVVNDGGHPSIRQITISYDERIKSVEMIANQGSYAARNAGIAASSGENFAFIDAGCWLHDNWFAEAEKAIAHADYVAGNIITDVSMCASLGEKLSYLHEFDVETSFLIHGFGPTANVLLTRQLIETVGTFDGRLRSGGDLEFGTRIDNFPDLRKSFAESLIVFHAPRRLWPLLRKEKRIGGGAALLRRYYPERWPWVTQSTAPSWAFFGRKLMFHLRPPPSNSFDKASAAFGFWTAIHLYLLMWAYMPLSALMRQLGARDPVRSGAY